MPITTFNNIANTVSTVWNMVGQQKQLNSGLEILTNEQLIELSDYIQDIFRGTDMLDPPSLCVIGSQSSGKSITLNGLTGIDILPKGKSIVTRTPIHVRLSHTKNKDVIIVEFYDNIDLQRIVSSFTIDAKTTPNEQLIPVRNEIIRLTDLYAGQTKNVVDIPINIKIKSPNVPPLSIIDLPGMTHIALTDKGQPEDIKDNIENMLIKYIKNPRTIILAIIPATIDVESDMGLGLIKKYDPEFKRTIGVITKIDMLKDSNVIPYLSNNISKNLQLNYGYFAVRNRSTEESETMTVKDGYELEKKFFNNISPYKESEYKSRMGSINLGNKLSDILITHIKLCLPTVMEEIKKRDREIDAKLDEIGRNHPITDTEKRTTLNILLHEFQREYDSSIRCRGSTYNTGARIAECFYTLKNDMKLLNPFTKTIYSDNIINTLVKDYNGIHMPDITISTGVIEKCFQGIEFYDNKSNNTTVKTSQPLMIMKKPFIKCIQNIQNIMCSLVDTILQRDRFNRFPKLCSKIKEIIINTIIPNRYDDTHNHVTNFFIEETECIWTNDQKFRCEILPSMFNSSKDGVINPDIIRNVLTGYFNVIRDIANHSIHKKIITFFVNKTVNDINTSLTDYILIKSNVNDILEENKEKSIVRSRLLKMKEKIDSAKLIITGL